MNLIDISDTLNEVRIYGEVTEARVTRLEDALEDHLSEVSSDNQYALAQRTAKLEDKIPEMEEVIQAKFETIEADALDTYQTLKGVNGKLRKRVHGLEERVEVVEDTLLEITKYLHTMLDMHEALDKRVTDLKTEYDNEWEPVVTEQVDYPTPETEILMDNPANVTTPETSTYNSDLEYHVRAINRLVGQDGYDAINLGTLNKLERRGYVSNTVRNLLK
jgi:chromosome segregation ATPase